jgi:hypothetical protein
MGPPIYKSAYLFSPPLYYTVDLVHVKQYSQCFVNIFWRGLTGGKTQAVRAYGSALPPLVSAAGKATRQESRLRSEIG